MCASFKKMMRYGFELVLNDWEATTVKLYTDQVKLDKNTYTTVMCNFSYVLYTLDLTVMWFSLDKTRLQ